MKCVAGYVVALDDGCGGADVQTAEFVTPEGALDWARRACVTNKRDYYVCKLVPTHFIKHPVMPEPEVQEVGDVAVAP